MLKTARHLAEYAALRAALLPLDALPLSAARFMAERLADAAFVLAPARRRLAVANLMAAGICDSPSRAAAVARASFRHFASLLVESLKAPRFLAEQTWRRHVTLHADPPIRALLEDPSRGLIVATGHLGCWEVGAQALSHLKPLTAVARRMNNPYADRFMLRRRAGQRFRTTPKRGASGRRLLPLLREGEAVALMIDQHARSHGMPIEFFGRPAATHTAPARLHLLTGAPLCFAACLRTGPARYDLRLSDPIVHAPDGSREQAVRAVLVDLTRRLEEAVRMNPAQYMWGHRRWRLT